MTKRLTLKQQSAAPPVVAASVDPVARVLVDTGLSHLDEPYDYLVPASLDHLARPGVRVRVRFARRLVDGVIVDRIASSEFVGKLSTISSVVSPEVVMTSEQWNLIGAVAERFGGAAWDVYRSAIPRRHAKTETAQSLATTVAWPGSENPVGYPLLPAFLESHHTCPRGVLQVAASHDPYALLAGLIQGVAAQGKGVLLIAPDERDVSRFHTALGADSGVVVLRADLSPSERYRRYLRLSRGVDNVCVGTRAAAFAPIKNLGLLIVWDDGDESHYEQHSPGWNSRDVAALRSHLEKVPLLLAGFNVSVDAARLLESNWARLISSDSSAPKVEASDEEFARVNSKTWKAIKDASQRGPVLVSVARLGYLPVLQCRHCKSPAVCVCGGRIAQPAGEPPQCQLCHAIHESYHCRACGGSGVWASVIGIERTMEEFGKAFPKVVIKQSTAQRPLATLPNKPMIVISTQGVEPLVEGGYEAVVILDAQSLLLRAELRAEEEARRRWFNVAALVKPGGRILIAADGAHPAVQSLIRWSPASAALRELDERATLHLPPAWDLALVDLPEPDEEALAALRSIGEVLGPIPLLQGSRYVVRSPRGLARGIKAWVRGRSARREAARVRINPFTW